MYAVDNQDRDTEGDSMPGRREGEQWTDPRVVVSGVQAAFAGCSLFVAVISLAVIVFGGLLGSYMLMQKNDVSSEMTNAQVAVEIQKLSVQVAAVGADVKVALTSNTAQDGTIDRLVRSDEEQKERMKDMQAMIDKNEKDQRDYNFNLKGDIAEVAAALKK